MVFRAGRCKKWRISLSLIGVKLKGSKDLQHFTKSKNFESLEPSSFTLMGDGDMHNNRP